MYDVGSSWILDFGVGSFFIEESNDHLDRGDFPLVRTRFEERLISLVVPEAVYRFSHFGVEQDQPVRTLRKRQISS